MAIPTWAQTGTRFPYETTLLELVHALSQQCRSETEVVARARDMVLSGRVRLTGAFGGRVVSPVDR